MHVVAAGFSPVKGTRHLPYGEVRLEPTGPVGDRSFCLLDVEARRVLRTVQHPELMAAVARLDGEVLEVTLPSGATVAEAPEPAGETLTCEYWGREVPLELLHGPHAQLFADHLGKPVRLAAAPPGGVVFAAAVTLVGTASLHDLGERAGHPGLPAEAARFRATLVVETEEPYAEEGWLGREIDVDGARLRVGVPIPRCAVIDAHPRTGERDGRLLKTLAGYRPTNRAGEPVFGVYADVIAAGPVRPGSPVVPGAQARS